VPPTLLCATRLDGNRCGASPRREESIFPRFPGVVSRIVGTCDTCPVSRSSIVTGFYPNSVGNLCREIAAFVPGIATGEGFLKTFSCRLFFGPQGGTAHVLTIRCARSRRMVRWALRIRAKSIWVNSWILHALIKIRNSFEGRHRACFILTCPLDRVPSILAPNDHASFVTFPIRSRKVASCRWPVD